MWPGHFILLEMLEQSDNRIHCKILMGFVTMDLNDSPVESCQIVIEKT